MSGAVRIRRRSDRRPFVSWGGQDLNRRPTEHESVSSASHYLRRCRGPSFGPHVVGKQRMVELRMTVHASSDGTPGVTLVEPTA